MDRMDRMGIEKEYDARYEGFDYDDVDEGVQEKYWAEVEGNSADNDDDNDDVPGRTYPTKRRRVRGNNVQLNFKEGSDANSNLVDTLTDVEERAPATIQAKDVLQMHDKIVKALLSAPHLKHRNPDAIASKVVFNAAPIGSPKPIALSKLANWYRNLTKTLSSTDATKIDEFLRQDDDTISDESLSGYLLRLDRELQSPRGNKVSSEENLAGILLHLSSLPVSATQLGKNAKTCRAIRKLRKDRRTLVSRAASIVTEVWRATVLNSANDKGVS